MVSWTHWAVRSARGFAGHASLSNPPPAERPDHLGWRLRETEMSAAGIFDVISRRDARRLRA
jgi:hypothetical protein